jgi:hypothetical protein
MSGSLPLTGQARDFWRHERDPTEASDRVYYSGASCIHMALRNPLSIIVFRASSRVQMIPSERDLL